MGASGWQYFVPYDRDIAAALHRLRAEVFAARNYFKGSSRRAAKAKTIAEAIALAAEDGTHSILDVNRVRDTPAPQPMLQWMVERNAAGEEPDGAELNARLQAEIAAHGAVSPLAPAVLLKLFGTERPTRAAIEEREYELATLCPRNAGVYLIAFDERGAPVELFFFGISGD